MLYKQKNIWVFIIASITCLFSLLVGLGWIFNFTSILSIIPNAATMKFNTALSFSLTSIGLFILFKEQKFYSVLRISIASFLIALGMFSLIQYIFELSIGIDNFFVQDTNLSTYPGRMSPATSLCFILLGIGFWGVTSKHVVTRNISQHLILATITISFVSTITYILSIPSENKTMFWNSMAIHTSILFLISSIALSLKNSEIGFINLISGSHTGSKLIRLLLPFLIFLPSFLSYLLINILNKDNIHIDFGIAIFTTIFILFSIVFISVLAKKENTNDLYRKDLEASLKDKNKEFRAICFYCYT